MHIFSNSYKDFPVRASLLDEEAPRNLASHIFELVMRKNKTVEQEMRNDAWISALRNKITTTVQLQEFVALWIRLQDVSLQSEMQDTISWRWSSDEQYSPRSAYHIQFKGSYIKYNSNLIWKAHSENKCKLFTDKILTVDN